MFRFFYVNKLLKFKEDENKITMTEKCFHEKDSFTTGEYEYKNQVVNVSPGGSLPGGEGERGLAPWGEGKQGACYTRFKDPHHLQVEKVR